MAPQRYCRRLARYWRALRLSADRAARAGRKPAWKAEVLAHEDKVPRETNSPLEGNGFELSVPRRESNEARSGTGTVTGRQKSVSKRYLIFRVPMVRIHFPPAVSPSLSATNDRLAVSGEVNRMIAAAIGLFRCGSRQVDMVVGGTKWPPMLETIEMELPKALLANDRGSGSEPS